MKAALIEEIANLRSQVDLKNDKAAISVLLIEDAPVDAKLIQRAFADEISHSFRLEWVTSLSAGLERLGKKGIEIILLDLSLPGHLGIEAFDQIMLTAPNCLTLLLTDAHNEEIAKQVVQRGASDYFLKSHIDNYWLPRALRCVFEHRVAEDSLRRAETRFRAMSDASPLGIFVSDALGHCIYTNSAYHRISGFSFEEALGTQWSGAIHHQDRKRVFSEWLAAAHSHKPFQSEFRFLRGDQKVVWARVNAAAMREGNKLLGYVQTIEDITQRKYAESKLRATQAALYEEKERAQVTLNSIGDAVLSTDVTSRITFLNRVAEKMTGWTCQDAVGRPLDEVINIIDGNTRHPAENPLLSALTLNKTMTMALGHILVRRDGVEYDIEDSASPIHDREGRTVGAVMVFQDVSETRGMALKMSYLAQHDFLTNLPNRALLNDRLAQAIMLAHRHGKQLAVIFLDLDRFKHINDSLGHAIGDKLLESVAERLVTCVRSSDTVSRQGGDEFVILLSSVEHAEDTVLTANKMLTTLALPYLIGQHDLHITASIGISTYPDDGKDVEALIKNADIAMYHAKGNGRNNYQFFKQDMNARAVERQSIESSLRRALERHEFVLHYQPKINLETGAITGTEALIRWRHPYLGLLPPAQFVPIAEDSGLIVPIGAWVLREACRQARAWQDAGLCALPVAVNISAVQFKHRDFLKILDSILMDTGLAPRFLELELTESVLMQDAESAASLLQALKTRGVQLAVDDFGTGYSSLSYLKRFPIDTLKIDQSFVHDLTTDPDDAAIVSAVISMGKSLKQRVIAEGVETRAQFAFLQAHCCGEGQGYYFSPPVAAQDIAKLLAKKEVGSSNYGHHQWD